MESRIIKIVTEVTIMKKIKAILVTLFGVTLIGAVCALTACKGGEIVIEDKNKPQTVFVQGNPIDLAGGKLTVTEGGNTTEIPLEDKDVVVSGYDRYSVGNQTITVTYAGSSTTMEITVVPRIAAKNYTEKYFVGESFDRTRGELQIYNDDGTYFGVMMNDERVSVQFNSSVAGPSVAVNASYTDGETSYSGSFNVGVYTVESAVFTAPTQKTYQSHENNFNPAGGYFNLTGDGGNFTKNVALTADMVSGFDTSIVTQAISTYEQTLTAEYAGKSERFRVTVTYSAVSEVMDMAARLASLPTITKSEQKKAYGIVQKMMAMGASELALISSEEQLAVARAAAMYGLEEWNNAIAVYDAAFVPAGNNRVTYVNSDTAAMEMASAALVQDTALSELSAALTFISTAYGNAAANESTTFARYLSAVLTPAGIDNAVSEMKYMLGMYDLLGSAKIPAGWTAETLLTSYKENVDAVISYIKSNGYNATSDRGLYACVTSWRTDAFDILYTYAYGIRETDGGSALELLNSVYLPQELETLYENIVFAYNAMSSTYMMVAYMQNGYIQPAVLDMTAFMRYYNNAMTVAESVLNEESPNYEMNSYLFQNLSFEGFSNSGALRFSQLLGIITSNSYGYYFNAGAMRDDAEFSEMWEDYLEVYENYLSDPENYFRKEGTAAEIDSLFNKFLNLSPTRQYYFLTSMNYPYAFYGQVSSLPSNALDITGSGVSFFTSLLASNYYGKMITKDSNGNITGGTVAFAMFGQLLSAIEDYAACSTEAFLSDMGALVSAYEYCAVRAAEEITIFDAAVGDIYSKYKTVYDKYDYMGNREWVALSEEWSAKFLDMVQSLDLVFTLSNNITSQNRDALGFMLATFEHVDSIAAEIALCEDESVKEAFSNEVRAYIRSVNSNTGAVTSSKVTLEYSIAYYRKMYYGYLDNFGLYDLYVAANLSAFTSSAYSLMLTYYNSGEYSSATARNIMGEFIALSDIQRFVFMTIDGGSGFFSRALAACFSECMTAPAATTANAFMTAVRAYTNYAMVPNGTYSDGVTYVEYFVSAWRSFEESNNALVGVHRTYFNDILNDAYNFYNAKYNQLLNNG